MAAARDVAAPPGGPRTKPGRMETLREALARLERRGFVQGFRALPDGALASGQDPPLAPETLIVEEVVRFEGESDPEDQAVLFALRSPDGRVRGTFVASYGVQMDPDCAAAVERLDDGVRARDGERRGGGR